MLNYNRMTLPICHSVYFCSCNPQLCSLSVPFENLTIQLVECKDLPSVPFLLMAVSLISSENNGSWPPKLMLIDSRWSSSVANVLPARFLNISVLTAYENLAPVLEVLLEMLLGRNNIAADMLVIFGNHWDYANFYLLDVWGWKRYVPSGHREPITQLRSVYSRRTETSSGLHF